MFYIPSLNIKRNLNSYVLLSVSHMPHVWRQHPSAFLEMCSSKPGKSDRLNKDAKTFNYDGED